MATKLYVGNLSYNTTDATLRAQFGADGRQVQEVAVMMDRMTGRSRGFAFVTMATQSDAEAAIKALDGREVDGRALRVNEARPRATAGGAGGRDFGGGGARDFGGRAPAPDLAGGRGGRPEGRRARRAPSAGAGDGRPRFDEED